MYQFYLHRRKPLQGGLVILFFLVFAVGCTSASRLAELESEVTASRARSATLEEQLGQATAQSQAFQQEAEATQAALDAARSDHAAEEPAPPFADAAPNTPNDGLFPPNAEAGMCYSRLYIDPEMRTVTERILTRERGERIETVPAVYEDGVERVLVKEAGEEIIEVKPAVYEWRTENVEVRSASYRLEEVEAVYRTEVDSLLIRPARTVWKSGEGRIYGAALTDASSDVMRDQNGRFITRVNTDTGQVMCLVEEPAEYRRIERRVVVSGASTRRVEIPAEYEAVRKQVMVRAPEVVKREIPAQYKNRRVRRLVTPARENRITIPAEYGEVTRSEIVSDGRAEWLPILCEINFTRMTVRRLQTALKGADHYAGPIDGIYGPMTTGGVTSYQRANSLTTGGLTLETLDHLNVQY